MLEVTGVSKQYGAVTALKDVSLSLAPGEIRALLGANGSGKSTLVKILGGIVRMNSGAIALNGSILTVRSPYDARKNGIAVAYQDLSIVPRLKLAENIVLGREKRKKIGTLDNADAARRMDAVFRELDMSIPPDAETGDLDTSLLSLLEVAKAIAMEPEILILDEVTASLHHDQVKKLFSVLKGLKEKGVSILFVTHRLDEVFMLCDTATILRNGMKAADIQIAEADRAALVYHMTGKQIEEAKAKDDGPDSGIKALYLSVEGLCVGNKVKHASIKAGRGEIVGIGGLQGQGQYEFLRALYGAMPFQKGGIYLDGKPAAFKTPAKALRAGVGFISGDREKEGIFNLRSVSENLFIAVHAQQRLLKIIRKKKQRKNAEELIGKLKVVTANTAAGASSLSGGNQQKLVIGRWLSVKPRLLILDDPTKGVDVNARMEIHQLLKDMTATGMSVLISSSDNEELLAIADRIYVFYEGEITVELKGADRNEERLVAATLGVARSGEGDGI